MRAFSGIRTHDPSVRASEDCSCFTVRDVFSMGQPRDYINSSVVETERKWSESSEVTEEGFGSRLNVSYCN
jgi:hypothetical protein